MPAESFPRQSIPRDSIVVKPKSSGNAGPAPTRVKASKARVARNQKQTRVITKAKPPAKPAPELLADKYYLDNFNYLVEFVRSHYAHLLNREEQQFCFSFSDLTENARQLFVRLVLRTHENIRFSRINYTDIDINPALEELTEKGFVQQKDDCISQYLHLFSRAELKSALSVPVTEPNNIDPNVWITADLFGETPAEKLLTNDRIITVNFKETIVTFRILFFGNLHQDFSSFVLRDLGLQRYESYTIDRNTLLFKTREQLDAYLLYFQCREGFDDACQLGSEALRELSNFLPEKIHEDKALCRRLDKLNNKIARQLERESELDSAAIIYASTIYPPARERLTRIEAKRGNSVEALNICRAILDSPRNCDELDFATSFGQRLAKKSKIEFKRTSSYKPPESFLTLEQTNLSVEFAVALHLAKDGKCYYLENNLLSGMFGLAFWDIIFAPVNGVFFHPFQTAPADFYELEFVLNREQQIKDRLGDILNGSLGHYVRLHRYHKRGIRNPMVNWRMCRNHILDLAIREIPAAHWHTIFQQLLTDIRSYKSGQPDLVYFPNDGGYQLIEVKAPGDKLQTNQQRWMRFFKEQNIPHSVVNVEWLDDS